MKKISNIVIVASFVALIILSTACSPSSGNEPGHEYMPDMAHSIAYEANYSTYYDKHRFGDEETYRGLLGPRKPVEGTIPRGYVGADSDNWVSKNGYVPYYYGGDDSSRTLASNDSDLDNPFPITEDGLARGKDLYNKYCGICHGEKGDGNGKLYDDGDGPYINAPTNYLTDDLYNAKDGRFYHVIMRGKGVMGSYADKLSYEERYQVIHHIRSLQAKEQGLTYDPVPVEEEGEAAPSDSDADGEGHEGDAGHEEEGHDDGHGDEDGGH